MTSSASTVPRAAAMLAILAGVSVLVWWVLVLAGLMPEMLAPDTASVSHVIAEVLLGAALVGSGAVVLRTGIRGRVPLAAALGATVYAAVNATSDYAGKPAVVLVLAVTALAATLAFVAVARHR